MELIKTPQSTLSLITAGNQALSHGKHKQALKRFRRAIEDEPKNPEALEGMARALVATQQFEKAAEFAKLALKIDAQRPMAHLVLSAVHRQEKQFVEGEKEIKKALEISPKNGQAYCSLAELQLAKNNPKQALCDIERAITLGFNHPKVHFLMGVIHGTLQHYRKSAIEFRQALFNRSLPTKVRIISGLAMLESYLERIWIVLSLFCGLLVLVVLFAPLRIAFSALIAFELIYLSLAVKNLFSRPRWSLLLLFVSGGVALLYYLAHLSPWAWI